MVKSYNSLDDAIFCLNNNEYIFKQNILKNKPYTLGTLSDIRKFASTRGKFNIYEYIDKKKKLKLFFYIKLINSHSFNEVLDINLKKLNFDKKNLIIIKENDLIYKIIHKNYYFINFYEMINYLYNFNLLQIYYPYKNFTSCIVNSDIQTTFKKFDESIISNIIDCKLITNKLQNYYNFETKYVGNINDYFIDRQIMFIKSKMGSGKSTSSVNFIKQNNFKSILIISCRRSLTSTIYDKLKQNNIQIDNYLKMNKNNIKNSKNLIISPDSIEKLSYPLKKFDFIWIDESVSFIHYLTDCIYINKTNFIIIQYLLQNANKILLTDADFTLQIINFYKDIFIKSNNYVYLHYWFKNEINIQYNLFNNDNEKLLQNIKQDLENHKKLYIACDTLTGTKKIYEQIIEMNIIQLTDILVINSETSKSCIKINNDVNNNWIKFRVIIVSPSIIFGLDFNQPHIHKVYSILKGGTITAREATQQINRIRNILDKIVDIYLSKKKNSNYETNLLNIKYLSETNDFDNLIQNKQNIKESINKLEYSINTQGYKILDINNPINYLFFINIYEKNKSINNFQEELINSIKSI